MRYNEHTLLPSPPSNSQAMTKKKNHLEKNKQRNKQKNQTRIENKVGMAETQEMVKDKQ